ncbi:unnamed protein product [Meganyctiphanes norvegica]|uniref:Uncharacterized protein n=1 Tax=Meganyctiphanes norvegica TaxID=48144 RepID=A0AAV2QQ56_MEGNR
MARHECKICLQLYLYVRSKVKLLFQSPNNRVYQIIESILISHPLQNSIPTTGLNRSQHLLQTSTKLSGILVWSNLRINFNITTTTEYRSQLVSILTDHQAYGSYALSTVDITGFGVNNVSA